MMWRGILGRLGPAWRVLIGCATVYDLRKGSLHIQRPSDGESVCVMLKGGGGGGGSGRGGSDGDGFMIIEQIAGGGGGRGGNSSVSADRNIKNG